MPTHVYANTNEVASKAAGGKSIAAFPDVCFSPPAPPVGPMPLPYPNTGEVKDTDSGTAKVFVKDKMSGMGDDSYMTKSMGDEAATQNYNKNRSLDVYIPVSIVLYSIELAPSGKDGANYKESYEFHEKQTRTISLLDGNKEAKPATSLIDRVKGVSAESILGIFKEKMKVKGVQDIEEYVKSKVCLVGIRAAKNEYNSFDDVMCLVLKTDKGVTKNDYMITTEPGNPASKPARLCVINTDCYKYTFGIHGSGKLNKLSYGDKEARIKRFRTGSHAALLQVGKILAMSDTTVKDGVLNPTTLVYDAGGINIHCSTHDMNSIATFEAPTIDDWSTGCQVFKKLSDYKEFLKICINMNALPGCDQHCMNKDVVIAKFLKTYNIETNKGEVRVCYNSEKCFVRYVLVDEKDVFDVKNVFGKGVRSTGKNNNNNK